MEDEESAVYRKPNTAHKPTENKTKQTRAISYKNGETKLNKVGRVTPQRKNRSARSYEHRLWTIDKTIFGVLRIPSGEPVIPTRNTSFWLLAIFW